MNDAGVSYKLQNLTFLSNTAPSYRRQACLCKIYIFLSTMSSQILLKRCAEAHPGHHWADLQALAGCQSVQNAHTVISFQL